VYEPGGFDSRYYSHKFRSAGLRYEIGVHMNKSLIVWACGGVPCGVNSDLTLARSHVAHLLADDEKLLADDGYRDGLCHFITPADDAGMPDNFHRLHKRQMSRHETVNRRMKEFGVLSQIFRHKSDARHQLCFRAVLNIVQLKLVTNPRLLMDSAF
jgi:hypothetical protein